MSEVIVSSPQPEVIQITLNRPEKRNALNHALIDAFLDALEGIENKGIVLILEGAGSSFCSGADLTELSSGVMEKVGKLLVALATIPIPSIAYVHGHVAAGGVGLAAAVDLAVANDDATFFLPELEKGIAPLFVEVLLRKILSERHFKEMAFAGFKVTAKRALEMGLVNSIGKESLQPMIQGLLKCDPKAFQRFKSHLNSYRHLEIEFSEALKVQTQLIKSTAMPFAPNHS